MIFNSSKEMEVFKVETLENTLLVQKNVYMCMQECVCVFINTHEYKGKIQCTEKKVTKEFQNICFSIYNKYV